MKSKLKLYVMHEFCQCSYVKEDENPPPPQPPNPFSTLLGDLMVEGVSKARQTVIGKVIGYDEMHLKCLFVGPISVKGLLVQGLLV